MTERTYTETEVQAIKAAVVKRALQRVHIPDDVRDNENARAVVYWSRREIRKLLDQPAEDALNAMLEKERKKPNREFYDAFCAMRNDLNEIFGDMPSQEAALLQGPEMIHETSALVEALRTRLNAVVGAVEDTVGFWLSAALEDPNVCDEMKSDIERFFSAVNGEPIAALEQVKEASFAEGYEHGRKETEGALEHIEQVKMAERERWVPLLEDALDELKSWLEAEDILDRSGFIMGETPFLVPRIAAALRGESE